MKQSSQQHTIQFFYQRDDWVMSDEPVTRRLYRAHSQSVTTEQPQQSIAGHVKLVPPRHMKKARIGINLSIQWPHFNRRGNLVFLSLTGFSYKMKIEI